MSKRKRVNFICDIKQIGNGYLVRREPYLDSEATYYATLEEAVKAAKTELTRLLIKHGRL